MLLKELSFKSILSVNRNKLPAAVVAPIHLSIHSQEVWLVSCCDLQYSEPISLESAICLFIQMNTCLLSEVTTVSQKFCYLLLD